MNEDRPTNEFNNENDELLDQIMEMISDVVMTNRTRQYTLHTDMSDYFGTNKRGSVRIIIVPEHVGCGDPDCKNCGIKPEPEPFDPENN